LSETLSYFLTWHSSLSYTAAHNDKYSQIMMTLNKHVFWYQYLYFNIHGDILLQKIYIGSQNKLVGHGFWTPGLNKSATKNWPAAPTFIFLPKYLQVHSTKDFTRTMQTHGLPGHLTSIKYELGCWTSLFNLCFRFSSAGDGCKRSFASYEKETNFTSESACK
jgi:hypothetical protein